MSILVMIKVVKEKLEMKTQIRNPISSTEVSLAITALEAVKQEQLDLFQKVVKATGGKYGK